MSLRKALLSTGFILFFTACNLPTNQNIRTPNIRNNVEPTTGIPQPLPGRTEAVPATNTNTPTVTITWTPTFTNTVTLTPTNSNTPTNTLTSTPNVPMVTPASVDVNCRYGPSKDLFDYAGALMAGESSEVHGKNSSGTWWYIRNLDQPGGFCWVSAAVTVVSGNTSAVPVIPDPAGFVLSVVVEMTPTTATVPGCVFPYTFSVKFWIRVSGPVSVVFQRSKSNGSSAPLETTVFAKFGTKEFNDSYAIGAAGDYWFKVVTSSPNAKSGTGTAKAKCP